MRKTFQYRLYPSKSQIRVLEHTLEVCRWVYNRTLATRKDAYEERKESVSLYDTRNMLTVWKKEDQEYNKVYSQVLQNVQERVDLAFQAFFRRVRNGENPGYPRFKGKGRYDSFTFPQSGFNLIENHHLRLSKIGEIKIWMHRPIEGKIKTLAVRRTSTGKWYACFSCEVETKPLPENTRAVGIDVGLEKFATLSTGEYIENPRYFRKGENALAKAQRKLSKLDKESPKRANQRHVVSHIHEKISNQRKDFAHKLSRRLVDEFGIIVFEKLNITNMTQNHCLAKSIQDAAWNQLIQFTTYKAEDAGRSVVMVNPNGTSKKCSRCGTMVDKDLSVRIHVCPTCGLEINRDLNASYNILGLGLQSLGLAPRSHPL